MFIKNSIQQLLWITLQIFGDFTFNSKISEYPKVIEQIKEVIPKELTLIFGLEDVKGNDRSLAVF